MKKVSDSDKTCQAIDKTTQRCKAYHSAKFTAIIIIPKFLDALLTDTV